MQRELNKRVLAVAMVLIAGVAVTTFRTSNVRAADGNYQLVEN